jgi:hypothetical protein
MARSAVTKDRTAEKHNNQIKLRHILCKIEGALPHISPVESSSLEQDIDCVHNSEDHYERGIVNYSQISTQQNVRYIITKALGSSTRSSRKPWAYARKH